MKISLIMATYNSEKTIRSTINSILEQDYENFELIIIDGLSKDNTCSIIKRINSPKLTKFITERDSGVYSAFNKGLKYIKGNWVFFIGSDDIFYDKYVLSKIANHLCSKYDLVYTKVKIGEKIFQPKFNNLILLKNTIHHQGAFYNKKVFEDFSYNEKFKISSDYELNFKLFKNKSKTKFVNMITSTCGTEGLSGSANIVGYEEEIKIRNKYVNNTVLICIFSALTYLRRSLKLVFLKFR